MPHNPSLQGLAEGMSEFSVSGTTEASSFPFTDANKQRSGPPSLLPGEPAMWTVSGARCSNRITALSVGHYS